MTFLTAIGNLSTFRKKLIIKGVNSRSVSYPKAVAKLIFNALGFRYHRLTASPLKPQVVSLALTSRCNSHCMMCNIWKRKGEFPDIESLEMSSDEINRLLSKPMFSELVEVDFTGGEPHLREDLAEISLGIAGLKNSSLPKLKSIIITSNGFLPEKILSNYERILENLKGVDVDLVSVSSLDGIGELHDKIRGTKGAFELLSATIDGLLALRNKYTQFIPGIKTTILPYNVDVLDDILDFALARNLFHIISPVFFTEGRFRNRDKREKLMLSEAGYNKILKFYRRDELKSGYFYSRSSEILATGRKQWACTAGFNYLFIEFDGRVFPCEMTSTPLGNLRQQTMEEIWQSRAFLDWRKGAGRLDACRKCLEPGAIRFSACAEGSSYLRFLRKLGRRHFSESLYHEGYFKYL
jgi:MoaA/NifB/PqqE/SkfB family radical SAM enzyme